MIVLNAQPRSKSSMMMRILKFGGVPIETDTIEHKGDLDKYRNPYGFFEVHKKPSFTKCFKCVRPLAQTEVPKDSKIIFLQRDLEQHIKSWNALCDGKGPARELILARRKRFEEDVKSWNHILIKTEDMLENPRRECERIKEFIKDEVDFNVEEAIKAIDHSLTIIR